MLNIKSIDLLDTTLRDGSYAVDFQFTELDTSIIALGLEQLGFRWIEIGHGLGLNASGFKKNKAAASDREYLSSVFSILKKAKFGTFFIPGIGRKKDLDIAKEYRMHFVRIGTNVNEIEDAEDYIKHSKKLGFIVSSNLMKSYVLSPQQLLENAKKTVDYGTDIVCLVDSAGCMLPEDVESYFAQLSKLNGVILGFHGHNNLGLAVANTLKAIECGAKLVDVSLHGLGRSSGNTPSEILLAILKRKGIFNDIDFYKTLEFGHKMISPVVHKCGLDPIDIISGYAKFHSSYTEIINKYADMYQVDPKELIVDLCAIDQIKASAKIVKNLALKLYHKRLLFLPYKTENMNIKIKHKGILNSNRLEVNLNSLCKQLNSLSKKHGKVSILNIVISIKNRTHISGFVQENLYCIIGTFEIRDIGLLKRAIRLIDGKIDYLLVDCEVKMKGNILDLIRKIKHSKVLMYKDNDSWVKSIFQQIIYLLSDTDKKIVIVGFNNLSVKLAILLSEVGFKVVLTATTQKHDNEKEIINSINTILIKNSKPIRFEANNLQASLNANVIIGLSPGKSVISDAMVSSIKKNGIILDGSLGSITESALKTANLLGIKMIRVDMGSAITAEAALGIGIGELFENRMGRTDIEGITCVAGGLFGQKGDIVLDSIKNPNFVVGIADGKGNVIYNRISRQYCRKIEKVEEKIALMKVKESYCSITA